MVRKNILLEGLKQFYSYLYLIEIYDCGHLDPCILLT